MAKLAGADTHVALLRGINVAGKNKLAMKDLTAAFVAAGCLDVRTYIQSGNVVFRTTKSRAAKLPERVAQAVFDRHGIASPIVMRTASEVRATLRANPFVRAGAAPDSLHVAFLADAPTAAALATLDPERSPGDEFEVRGRDVYLCCPNGYGRSKLTNAWFDAKLDTTSTVRNWRTVAKLVELCGS